MMSFADLVTELNPNMKEKDKDAILLCFDPGETTGVAVFKGTKLILVDQLTTKEFKQAILNAKVFISRYQNRFPEASISAIIEEYRVYSWKSESHSWANLHTSKFIGALITLCTLKDIPYTLRMAQTPKNFCTDEKLKAWGFYEKGMRHGRDAIRHGCYQILFPTKT